MMAPVRPTSGGLIGVFVRHPNAANLLMALMIIFGIFALFRINTQFFPTVEVKSVSVSVAWAGASAEDVEANILEQIEPEVRFLDGVKEIQSYAREGSGMISIEFDRGADMQQALSDVESAVASVTNLPEDADTPEVRPATFFDRVARLLVRGPYSENTLRRIAKDIRDGLVDRGIDKVSFTGLRDEEILVTIDERDLRRLNLTIAEVSAAIAGNSRDLPSGTLDGQVSKQIRALSDAENARGLGNVEIRSFASGEKIRLGDVADIRRRFDDDGKLGLSQGQQAIELYVQRTANADTLEVNGILDDYLESIDGTLPPGIEIVKYDVNADRVSQRIGLLLRNGAQGLVLVMVVLFIFLNARIAIWVAAGIPVALLATLGVMYMSGQSINMISLFALIMMLGVIVDDAIVVGEHTATRSALGDPAAVAAETGAGRMLLPVTAASLTTIAAFAPLMLVRDTIGQIMIALPLVTVAVVVASIVECFLVLPGHLSHALGRTPRRGWSFWRVIFIALTVMTALVILQRPWPFDPNLPALLVDVKSRLGDLSAPQLAVLFGALALAVGVAVEGLVQYLSRFRDRSHKRTAVRRALENGFDWFRDKPFAWLTERAFAYRYVTVAVAIASFVIAFSLISGGRLNFVFFPSPEAESIRARIVFHAGTPREQVDQTVRQVEAALYETAEALSPDEPMIVASFATLGSAGRSEGDNLAEMRVQLTSSEDRAVRTPDIVQAWRRAVPESAGIKRLAIYEQRGGPPGRDVDVRFNGRDIKLLKQAAEEAALVLSAYPGIGGVSDDLPYGKPELVIRLTPRGAALGFTSDEIGRQVRNALEGAIPRRFAEGDDEITIRVETRLREAGTAALRGLELRTPAGNFVSLEDVAELTERQGFSAIQRRNGISSVSVTADVDLEATTPGDVVRDTRQDMQAIASRHGLTTGFSGRNEERQKAFADLKLGAYIGLAVIYIILAWVFGSYAKPVAVMFIIPFGFVGMVAGHYWLGFDITILSLFGLLGLAGILVNDSIILVSRMTERLDDGEPLHVAAPGASRDRLRAVLLTSLTTIGGLVPLLTEKSLQAQFLMPMAITMVFGLAYATLLVLFLVPAVVGIGADIGGLFRLAAERRSAAEPAE